MARRWRTVPPRYVCPACGKLVTRTARLGRLRQHRNADRSPGAPWECPQSKATPTGAVEPASGQGEP